MNEPYNNYKIYHFRIRRSSLRKQMKNIETHKNRVLQMLNRGNLKEVQKLHTIGTKTAEQILLFRFVIYYNLILQTFKFTKCLTIFVRSLKAMMFSVTIKSTLLQFIMNLSYCNHHYKLS